MDGTPTDCVLLAVKKVLRERRPDLVLSGINGGSNAGEDMTYSGTVAAAMEATLLGIPAVALSQDYPDGSPIPWDTGKALGAEVIRRLLRQPWSANTLINVNFPGVPPDRVAGFAVTSQGKRDIAENLTEGTGPARPALLLDRADPRDRRRRTRHRHRRADREQGLDHADQHGPDLRPAARPAAPAVRVAPKAIRVSVATGASEASL